MARRPPKKILDAIASGDYDLTLHAAEEMAEDYLDIYDIESAIFGGELVKTEIDDPRGTRCTIHGLSADKKRMVGVVGRIKETGVFLIITAYEVS